MLASRATGTTSSSLRTPSRCSPEPLRIFSSRSMETRRRASASQPRFELPDLAIAKILVGGHDGVSREPRRRPTLEREGHAHRQDPRIPSRLLFAVADSDLPIRIGSSVTLPKVRSARATTTGCSVAQATILEGADRAPITVAKAAVRDGAGTACPSLPFHAPQLWPSVPSEGGTDWTDSFTTTTRVQRDAICASLRPAHRQTCTTISHGFERSHGAR